MHVRVQLPSSRYHLHPIASLDTLFLRSAACYSFQQGRKKDTVNRLKVDPQPDKKAYQMCQEEATVSMTQYISLTLETGSICCLHLSLAALIVKLPKKILQRTWRVM